MKRSKLIELQEELNQAESMRDLVNIDLLQAENKANALRRSLEQSMQRCKQARKALEAYAK